MGITVTIGNGGNDGTTNPDDGTGTTVPPEPGTGTDGTTTDDGTGSP